MSLHPFHVTRKPQQSHILFYDILGISINQDLIRNPYDTICDVACNITGTPWIPSQKQREFSGEGYLFFNLSIYLIGVLSHTQDTSLIQQQPAIW